VGQKSVLLRLVKAVDFVHEEYGFSLMMVQLDFCFFNNSAYFFAPGQDGGKAEKIGSRLFCYQARQSGLSGTGRPPENHGKKALIFY
jgi:hypothetical protein